MNRPSPILLLAALMAAEVASSRSHGEGPVRTVRVVAELVSVDRHADCGMLLVGTRATYRIIDGPWKWKGTLLDVIVPCIELPRLRFDRNAGDLQSFVPRDVHDLTLTTENASHATVLERIRGTAWYVKTAALHVQAPDGAR